MERIIFTQLSVDELREIIAQELERYFTDHPIIQPEPEEILNVAQVAELLHTTPQNIYAKRKAGKLPYLRFGGKVLFKRSEILGALTAIPQHSRRRR